MRDDCNATDVADNVYYEYWHDGVLQKCFKTYDEAFKHCKYEFNRYPHDTHCVYKARLHRTLVCYMIP